VVRYLGCSDRRIAGDRRCHLAARSTPPAMSADRPHASFQAILGRQARRTASARRLTGTAQRDQHGVALYRVASLQRASQGPGFGRLDHRYGGSTADTGGNTSENGVVWTTVPQWRRGMSQVEHH